MVLVLMVLMVLMLVLAPVLAPVMVLVLVRRTAGGGVSGGSCGGSTRAGCRLGRVLAGQGVGWAGILTRFPQSSMHRTTLDTAAAAADAVCGVPSARAGRSAPMTKPISGSSCHRLIAAALSSPPGTRGKRGGSCHAGDGMPVGAPHQARRP